MDSILPEDCRDPGMKFDAAGLEHVLADVARRHPDKFAEVASKLADVGRSASYTQGTTYRLQDFKSPVDVAAHLAPMKAELEAARNGAVDDADYARQRDSIWLKYQDSLEKNLMARGRADGNSIVRSVASGARGKPAQVRAMLATPGLYQDSQGRTVPLFVGRSFSQGLRPAEMLAGSYGARASVVSSKRATALGGDFCLAAGTGVRMADGSIKSIEEVRVGDWVMGVSASGVVKPVRVTAVFSQGLRPVVDIKFPVAPKSRCFKVLRVTVDHKFLTATGGRKGTQLDVLPSKMWGKRTRLCQPRDFDDTGMVSEPYALLAGLMVGDGSLPVMAARARVCFTCFDDSLIEDTSSYLASLGLHWQQRKTQPHQYRVSHDDMRANPFKTWLEAEGWKGKSPVKTLPAHIHSWDNASIWQFVAGYLATDGCITRKSVDGHYVPYVSFASASPELLEQLQQLLWVRFGIRGAEIFWIPVDKIKASFGAKSAKGIWSISSQRDVKLLAENIRPWLPGVKALLLDTLISVDGFGKNASLDQAVGVKSINDAGVCECFDIEVDHPDHLFLLGCGVICSNSKQLAAVSAPLVVTMKDCGTTNGLDLDIGDPSLRGRVTADGTVLDKHNLAELRHSGAKTVLARSALTCEAPEGVCARCLGLRPDGKFPKIGFAAGITAAQSLGEPITQMSLNMKHLSGQASGKKDFSGFSYINQFAQAPEDFPDGAAVAQTDGEVEDVRKAPQGGVYVKVGDHEHYVQPGFDVTVKPGDKVEAGDALSEGLVNPREIVELRGLGEGRRYYSDRLKQMLDDSGMKADPRNTELVARAALRHVRVDEPAEDSPWLPDDLVDYDRMRQEWHPPADVQDTAPEEAAGQWLVAPALHFTVGTRLTPRMTDRLHRAGVSKIKTTATDPGFRAEMPRLRTAAHVQDDWLAGQHTSYLKEQLLGSAERGADTNVESNIHFVPRLAVGQDFGKDTAVTGKF